MAVAPGSCQFIRQSVKVHGLDPAVMTKPVMSVAVGPILQAPFKTGRKREWFKIEDAIKVLQCHKPVHAEYLEKLKLGCSPTNGNSVVPTLPDDNSTLYVTSSQTPGKPSTVR